MLLTFISFLQRLLNSIGCKLLIPGLLSLEIYLFNKKATPAIVADRIDKLSEIMKNRKEAGQSGKGRREIRVRFLTARSWTVYNNNLNEYLQELQ